MHLRLSVKLSLLSSFVLSDGWFDQGSHEEVQSEENACRRKRHKRHAEVPDNNRQGHRQAHPCKRQHQLGLAKWIYATLFFLRGNRPAAAPATLRIDSVFTKVGGYVFFGSQVLITVGVL